MNDPQAPQTDERFYSRSSRAVPAARVFVRETLSHWGVSSERINEISLCASELVTNAVVHGVPPGRRLRLVLRRQETCVRVEVHDSGDGLPVLRVPEATDEENGRGLLLVTVLADVWGVDPRVPGKCVWCEFDLAVPGTGLLPGREPGAGPSTDDRTAAVDQPVTTAATARTSPPSRSAT